MSLGTRVRRQSCPVPRLPAFPVCPGMSAEEPQLRGTSCLTMPLDSNPWLQCPAGEKAETKEVEPERKWRSKSPTTGSSDVSDESEAESPPPVVRRKVSFADAFGLNLVSVKEFSSQDLEDKVEDFLCRLEINEYCLSCLFTLPSPLVLLEKVEERKVVLEAIDLLPGTTTLRGTVRVANLCFQKAVYVRTTYDCWVNNFDLLAEYIPGSSDGETDGFSFRLTVVPPLEPEGVRVEFCLRYETPVGEFWDSNDGMNYVLYFRKQAHREKDKGKNRVEGKEKELKPKGKQSCLKAVSKKIWSESCPAVGTVEIPDSVSHKAARAAKKAVDETDKYASEECLQKTLGDSRRSKRRARMAHVEDHFAQRETEALSGPFPSAEKNSHSSLLPECNLETWSNAATTTEPLTNEYASTGTDKAQVLTYHQIPLLSLSWDRTGGQRDMTNSHDNHCHGGDLGHPTENTQNESGGFTSHSQGAHPSEKNNTINAIKELSCLPLIASHSQSMLNQSDSALQVVGLGELEAAQTKMDLSVQDKFWAPASMHVTAACHSSVEDSQEPGHHVIDDSESDLGEGDPGLNRARRRAKVECVTQAASQLEANPEAVGLEGHKAPDCLSDTVRMPLCTASYGPERVTSQGPTRDEAETVVMAQKELTEQGTSEPVQHSLTQTTTEDATQTTGQAVTQATKKMPRKSGQSSAEIAAGAVASIETIEKTAGETTVMAVTQTEGEMMRPRATEAKKAHAVERATTQTPSPGRPLDSGAEEGLSPGPWEREGRGVCKLSANTMAKVRGGESQDRISPASGDDTVTFTDTDGASARERAHPTRHGEGGEEMVGEGKGERPFKPLNKREYKESGEAGRDTIWEKDGDLLREMSRLKATGQDVSVVSETDRLECKVSKERKEDYAAEDWRDEMEKCLGLGRKQGYVNEPALYEQFTKATKDLKRDHQSKFDSGMLTEGLGGMPDKKCLMGSNSTLPADPAGSQEEVETVTLDKGSTELCDAAPKACIVGGIYEGIITLADQQLVHDVRVPVSTPRQTLSSVQTTLGGHDPFLFHSEEESPVCQVGAVTWSTCGISAQLGDNHDIGVVLRHRRSPQTVEHLQSPVKEAEIHTQLPRIAAPGRGSDAVSSAPLQSVQPLWLNGLWSLSTITRGAVYAILFVMFFLTAWVCDLPVCLAVYLLPLCYWCCHSEKRPILGAKGMN